MHDPLEYYETEDSELSEAIVKQYREKNFSIAELAEELDTIQGIDYDDATEKSLRISILQAMISKKLGLPTLGHVGYFVDCTREILKMMQRELTDNEKFKAHRHKTFLGLYTEKAVY